MKTYESAYFAAGCFWCITPNFHAIEGVLDVVSGYSGGDEVNPTYDDVKNQKTSHRETVRVDFDPEIASYFTLLAVFFSSVDPYDAGGQFIDRGHSYTLAIYPTNEDQKYAAEASIRHLEAESGKKACIAVEPFKSFYPAEECHQDFYRKYPMEFLQELIDSGRLDT